MPHRLLGAAAAAALFGLGACAAAPAAGVRVVVELAGPVASPEQVAAHARNVAQVPVDYVASAGGPRHALWLHCADDAACMQAMERLREDVRTYRHVELDSRRRAHAP